MPKSPECLESYKDPRHHVRHQHTRLDQSGYQYTAVLLLYPCTSYSGVIGVFDTRPNRHSPIDPSTKHAAVLQSITKKQRYQPNLLVYLVLFLTVMPAVEVCVVAWEESVISFLLQHYIYHT